MLPKNRGDDQLHERRNILPQSYCRNHSSVAASACLLLGCWPTLARRLLSNWRGPPAWMTALRLSKRKMGNWVMNKTHIRQPTKISVAGYRRATKLARLRYVCSASSGLRRLRNSRRFIYVGSRGQRIRATRVIQRINRLAIPPAWKDVWICPDACGHLQATGRDARGRKQYRYHPRWRTIRDANKFDRILAFARKLSRLRARVRKDLRHPVLNREAVSALVVKLLEATLIRVGNDEYAKLNGSFGLTTLRNRHLRIWGASIHFLFRGKGGAIRDVELHNPRLARVLKRCQELPGQE